MNLRIHRALAGVLALAQIGAFVAVTGGRQASTATTCGTPGRDGSPTALSGIVNTYYPSPTTATVNAGSTAVAVGTPTSGTAVAAGDLLVIVQMQSAVIATGNTAGYGVASSVKAGTYEYAVAAGPATGGSIALAAPLVNSYVAKAYGTQGVQDYQVIRVPQYATATLAAGLTAPYWNGATGGVLALDVAGAFNLAGASVNVAGRGFRGGGGVQLTGPTGGSGTEYQLAAPALPPVGGDGSKGEGIAGSPRYLYDPSSGTVLNSGVEGLPNGSFARGAPANGGGGATDPDVLGNTQNAGGGGGGNGGAGGQGGNSWSSDLATGGVGGYAAPDVATKAVLGGGGGAGDRNNSSGAESSGGPGGGIVLVRTGSLTGSGSIVADGGTGVTPQNDGGGGGGAGGTIAVLAYSGALTGLGASAQGGVGTDANPNGDGGGGSHGPGGGGGGGYVVTSSAAGSTSIAGGSNGYTSDANGNGDSTAYGATPGSSGTTGTTTINGPPGSSAGATCGSALTIAKSGTANASPGGLIQYSIVVSNAGPQAANATAFRDSVPSGIVLVGTATCQVTTGAATCGAVSVSGQVVSSTITALPAASAVTFTVEGQSSSATTYTNTATITPPAGVYDPNPTSSSATTVVAASNGVIKSVADITQGGQPATQNTANPGDVLEYTLTYTNLTGIALANFTMKDATPANTTFVSAACVTPLPSGVTACNVTSPAVGSTGNVAWAYTGALPLSGVASFKLRVKVN
jgi:uncharacterized repeat protein (TIGR01451 family)